MNPATNRRNIWLIAAIAGISLLTVMADWSEAARLGGGSSVGSRGSRSFSSPQTATPHTNVAPTNSAARSSTPTPAAAAPATPRSGFWGGMGGMLAGGLLGGMLMGSLFGGMGGGMGGGSFGLLEILLLGGAVWFFVRWMRRRNAAQPSYEAEPVPYGGDQSYRREMNDGMNSPMPGNLPSSFTGDTNASRTALDPNLALDPYHFVEGAKVAFMRLQDAWNDRQTARLTPLLTERMMTIVEHQIKKRQEQGLKDRVEKISIQEANISESWQEAGINWITVRFVATMLEYAVDAVGRIVEGDNQNPVTIEEYWTFTQTAGTGDPNWRLSAIQQPGEAPASAI